jgi:hypothetical protein
MSSRGLWLSAKRTAPLLYVHSRCRSDLPNVPGLQMDLGVGSFVFSQGIVSAIPLIKDPAYLVVPVSHKLVTTARKCLPVLVLGLVRMLSVKGTQYPVR